MALKVARGFFRLWIALSILWIGGVGSMTWWTFPVDDWVVVAQTPAPPFDPDAFLAGKPQPEKPPFDPTKPT